MHCKYADKTLESWQEKKEHNKEWKGHGKTKSTSWEAVGKARDRFQHRKQAIKFSPGKPICIAAMSKTFLFCDYLKKNLIFLPICLQGDIYVAVSFGMILWSQML